MTTMSDGASLMFQAAKGAVSGALGPLGGWLGPSRYSKTTSNTALIFHNRRLFALVENGLPFELRAATLESIGPHDFDGKLRKAFTAHPKIDAVTGEMLAFGYNVGGGAAGMELFTVTPDGSKGPSISVHLHNNRQIMMHDMAFSKSYFIILDLPFTFSFKRARQGKPLLAFDESAPARVGLMRRDATDDSAVQWFDVESCFAFHVGASWEQTNEAGEQEVVLPGP